MASIEFNSEAATALYLIGYSETAFLVSSCARDPEWATVIVQMQNIR